MLKFTQRRILTISIVHCYLFYTRGLIVSIVLFCTVSTSLHSLASRMTVFDGSNFSEWYERVQFSLGVLDLDLALITDKPPEAMDDSTPE